MSSSAPLRASQTLAVLSELAVTMRSPSGLKAADKIGSLWLLRGRLINQGGASRTLLLRANIAASVTVPPSRQVVSTLSRARSRARALGPLVSKSSSASAWPASSPARAALRADSASAAAASANVRCSSAMPFCFWASASLAAAAAASAMTATSAVPRTPVTGPEIGSDWPTPAPHPAPPYPPD